MVSLLESLHGVFAGKSAWCLCWKVCMVSLLESLAVQPAGVFAGKTLSLVLLVIQFAIEIRSLLLIES